MNRLNGMRVLVTRPDPGGAELCVQIMAEGGEAIHCPTIAFSSSPNPMQFQEAIVACGAQDWLIFVSPQAVRASIPHIRQTWPHFSQGLQLAAVGAGTARALFDAGFEAIRPPQNWDSEGLLGMPEFHRVAGMKIMIVRGEGGREILEKVLAERGAIVTSMVAYQRALPMMDVSSYEMLIKQHQIDAIVCTSFEGISNLLKLFPSVTKEIKAIPLVVVSERIKMLAQDLGFQPIWLAANASHDAILMRLIEKE